jgi:hypothetical protein
VDIALCTRYLGHVKRRIADMPVSFEKDIQPLFREIDVKHMKVYGMPLDDYAFMSDPANNHGNATSVLGTVEGNPPSMPTGGPYWTADQVALFKKWMDDGYQS